MKKKTERTQFRDELRPGYDLSKLKGGVRGKYLARYRAGTNLVLLSPDVAEYFPRRAIRQYGLAHLDSRSERASPPASQLTASLRRGFESGRSSALTKTFVSKTQRN